MADEAERVASAIARRNEIYDRSSRDRDFYSPTLQLEVAALTAYIDAYNALTSAGMTLSLAQHASAEEAEMLADEAGGEDK